MAGFHLRGRIRSAIDPLCLGDKASRRKIRSGANESNDPNDGTTKRLGVQGNYVGGRGVDGTEKIGIDMSVYTMRLNCIHAQNND